ncbi:MAG TPA: signal peptidase I, partial [Dermatophilaceae bacterium]|nr:signal peptidase I [Dermatophilaceae bacterium]
LQRGPSIERGDVVVFDGTDTWGKPAGSDTASGPRQLLTSILAIVSLSSGADYVKRVVGVPGDHVVCCDVDGRLTINGVAVNEPYLYPGNPPSTTRFDVTVPAGKIWVMGDHRSASADSRSQMGKPGGGMVPLDDVVGRAWVRYWPLDRLGSLTPAPTLHDLPLPTGAAPS